MKQITMTTLEKERWMLMFSLMKILAKSGVPKDDVRFEKEAVVFENTFCDRDVLKRELNDISNDSNRFLCVLSSAKNGVSSINIKNNLQAFHFFQRPTAVKSEDLPFPVSTPGQDDRISYSREKTPVKERPGIYNELLATRYEQEKFKIPNNADVNKVEFDKPPLCTAAMMNHLIAIRKLCQAGANVLALESRGNTPLLWAIANSCTDAALLLLDPQIVTDKDALIQQINHPCRDGHTPLILAVAKGWTHQNQVVKTGGCQSAVILQLLKLGANVNAQDKRGRTALHYAFLHRDVEAIDALLGAGADPTLCDYQGHDPQDMLETSYKAVSDILLTEVGSGMTCDKKKWGSMKEEALKCLEATQSNSLSNLPSC